MGEVILLVLFGLKLNAGRTGQAYIRGGGKRPMFEHQVAFVIGAAGGAAGAVVLAVFAGFTGQRCVHFTCIQAVECGFLGLAN